MQPLRIGFVPEHFSTPLHFAREHFGLQADLVPFPSGTGHMIAAIRSGELDVGIGLTEGWIAGLGKEGVEGDGGYRLVGTYVESPLCWAISTGAKREDIQSVEDLRGSRLGVSRIGSGSYVMGFVLADQHAWPSPPFSSIVPLGTFPHLRDGVNAAGTADFFMWEHFTTNRFYASGELRRVGEIRTPWSSWKIVASTRLLAARDGRAALEDLFERLDRGIAYFEEHGDEAVGFIVGELGYTREDARDWLGTVRFARGTEGVRGDVVEGCVGILNKAGVLVEGRGMKPEEMIFGLPGR